tara:strand:+ start:5341 stop:5679 length:339 start_codon:yes stop_codon:yes gene_type:complete
MDIEYKLETKENELHVTVVIPHIDNPRWSGGHVRIVNEDVEAYLNSQNIDYGPSKTYIVGYNTNHDARQRTWVFRIPEKPTSVEKPKTAPKRTTRARRPRASKTTTSAPKEE